jgi:dual specificity MAP kinase phosphatase
MQNLTPKGRNDGHVFDYSKVSDQIFIGSDLCKAGVCLIHGEEFRALGVTVEINLSAENNELPPKDIESYTWLPVVDGYSPNQMQLEVGTSIMDTAIRDGKKIYVHCKNGHGRSPSLICAYFIRFGGMDLEEAISLVKKKRPEVHIEDTQRRELVEFSKKWSK